MRDRDSDTGSPAETREALLWLKKLAGQAARNRRESGLDATQQIKDVLAMGAGSAAERPSAGRDFPAAIDAGLPAFLIGARSWFRWACVAAVASVVVIIAGGAIAAYTFIHLVREEHASFAAQLQEQRQEFLRIRQDFLRDAEPAIYASRIRSGIERLGGRPQDRDRAIWDYLLRTLQETQSTDEFFDVVAQFRNVLPHLQLAVNQKRYRDSYRGELWIAVYLLESPVNEVAEQTRRMVPPIKTLRALYTAVSPELKDEQRVDLAKSIDRLERAVTTNTY
jgi:hypothetical protein